MIERQQWDFEHPLRQMSGLVPFEVLEKIESRRIELHSLREMTLNEIGAVSLCILSFFHAIEGLKRISNFDGIVTFIRSQGTSFTIRGWPRKSRLPRGTSPS
jgi:hypothetical protein